FTHEGAPGASRGIITADGTTGTLAVSQNVFTGWATGTYVNPGLTATITGNDFSGNVVGMSLDLDVNNYPDSANSSISGNSFENSYENIGIGAVGGDVDAQSVVGANTFEGEAPEVGIYPFQAGDGQDITGTDHDDVFMGAEGYVGQGGQTFHGGDGEDTI